MTALVDPRAAARIKAAFDTYELVVRTLHARGRARKPAAKAAPARSTTMIYDRGNVKIVTDRR